MTLVGSLRNTGEKIKCHSPYQHVWGGWVGGAATHAYGQQRQFGNPSAESAKSSQAEGSRGALRAQLWLEATRRSGSLLGAGLHGSLQLLSAREEQV